MNVVQNMPPRFRAALEEVANTRGVGIRDVLAPSKGSMFVSNVRDEVYATFRSMTLPGGRVPSYEQIASWMGRTRWSVKEGEDRHHTRIRPQDVATS